MAKDDTKIEIPSNELVARSICTKCKGRYFRKLVGVAKKGDVSKTKCPQCEKNETTSFLVMK